MLALQKVTFVVCRPTGAGQRRFGEGVPAVLWLRWLRAGSSGMGNLRNVSWSGGRELPLLSPEALRDLRYADVPVRWRVAVGVAGPPARPCNLPCCCDCFVNGCRQPVADVGDGV